MSLMHQVFRRSELHIDALCLEDNANLVPQTIRISCYIVAKNYRAPSHRNHQGGENSKQSGFAAAIRPQQPKQFCWLHIKRYAVQRSAIVVPVNHVLYGNNSRHGDLLWGNRRGVNGCVQGHKLFYATVLIIISANNSGR